MSKAYITPVTSPGLVLHGRLTPVASLEGTTVVLNVDATRTATTALHSAVELVRVVSDADAMIDIDLAGAAVASAGTFLPANSVEYFQVKPRGAVVEIIAKS